MKKALITFSQKDIEKNLLTTENLETVIDYVGDTTWCEEDFEDTIERVSNGEVVAIAFTRYDSVIDETMYLSHNNKNGEYTDVVEEYLGVYRNEASLVETSFKSILKTIQSNYVLDEDIENVAM